MPTFSRFEDIEAWKAGRQLTKRLYEVTSHRQFSSDRDLVRQIRRATISVCANIAEGFGRSINNEFIHFLVMSTGSVREIQSHLYMALDQNYISESLFFSLYREADTVANLAGGLVRYLGKSKFKGARYKKQQTENSKPKIENRKQNRKPNRTEQRKNRKYKRPILNHGTGRRM